MAQRLTVLIVVVTFGGCSLFMRGVPKDHEPPANTDCQPFILIPIVDGIVGGSALAVSFGGPCFDSKGSCALGLTASVAILAVAVYGYLKVKKCEKAIAQYESGSADPDDDSSPDEEQ